MPTPEEAELRSHFPILTEDVNGRPLVYLDNGASAQKPQVVIDAVTQAYAQEYANVHRGLHFLSNLATDKYEAVRGKIAHFLNAPSEDHIILNSGTTEGINMVSYGWAAPRLQAGDEILGPAGPAAGEEHPRGEGQPLEARVVRDVPAFHDSAVAVVGVLAQAHVGHHAQVRLGRLHRLDGALHDAVPGIGARPAAAAFHPVAVMPGSLGSWTEEEAG